MSVPLRHISVMMDSKQGAELPGLILMETAEHVEVLASFGSHDEGMDLLVEIKFMDGKTIDDIPPESAITVHHVHESYGSSSIATIHTTGPIMRLFTTTTGCWLSRPTWLNRVDGFRITISGTPTGVRTYRKALSELVPGALNMRISPTHPGAAGGGPNMSSRRKEVVDTAYSMGYYDTPRRCSQRELAERLNIRQATVAEHLQRAERDLIEFYINRRK